MKNRAILRIMAFALCLCALMLASCEKKQEFDFTLDSNGNYVDEKSGVTYVPVPFSYEAIEMGEGEVYTYGYQVMYPIVGVDPSEWIVDSVTGIVFRNANTPLPTFEEMKLSSVQLVRDSAMKTFVTDPSKIEQLRGLYLDGVRVERPNGQVFEPMTLRYCDSSIGICYVLTYYEYVEEQTVIDENGEEIGKGKFFLYDRCEDVCVMIDGLPEGLLSSKSETKAEG